MYILREKELALNMMQCATLPQNKEFKLKKIKPIWQLPVPTERNHNKENRTNASKEKTHTHTQKNVAIEFWGLCFHSHYISLWSGGSSRQRFKCWLSNIFPCGMSLRSKFKPIVISLHNPTYGVADLCRMVLCRCRIVMMLHREAEDSI